MPVGTYVAYKTCNTFVDTVLGIVIDTDSSDGFVKIEWFDGVVDWYNPVGLIKV